MRNEAGYNTKQRNKILSFLKANAARHLTVDDITFALSSLGISVGKTTVYRYMDKLANEGRVRKYFVSNSKSVCYEYIEDSTECHMHYHFKCTKCNHLLHVDCEMMDNVFLHMKSEHGFVADNTKTVIYGLCDSCAKAKEASL